MNRVYLFPIAVLWQFGAFAVCLLLALACLALVIEETSQHPPWMIVAAAVLCPVFAYFAGGAAINGCRQARAWFRFHFRWRKS